MLICNLTDAPLIVDSTVPVSQNEVLHHSEMMSASEFDVSKFFLAKIGQNKVFSVQNGKLLKSPQ